MTPAERLASYKRDLELLLTRRQHIADQLEFIDNEIHEVKVEIEECEAYMLADGDEW